MPAARSVDWERMTRLPGKSQLPVLSEDEEQELQANYREYYDENWMDEIPVRVCMPCFHEIND